MGRKHCPFCNGLGILGSWEDPRRGALKWQAHVMCGVCGALARGHGFFKSKAQAEMSAEKAWDRREYKDAEEQEG